MSMALMEVRYRGLSDYRVLEASQLAHDHGIEVGQHTGVPKGVADRINRDLAGISVNPQKDLVWGPHNNYKVVMDVDEAMERVLRDEGHFSLAAITDEGGIMPVAEARTSLDNPSHVEANIDGKTQANDLDPRDTDDDVPGTGETVDGSGPASQPAGTRGPKTTGRTKTR